jgi:hypothetical protein
MCICKEEDPTQNYIKEIPKKNKIRHHQPEGYQEYNVKAARSSGKVRGSVNWRTRPGGA